MASQAKAGAAHGRLDSRRDDERQGAGIADLHACVCETKLRENLLRLGSNRLAKERRHARFQFDIYSA